MQDTSTRIPAVSGRFYPSEKNKLAATIQEIYLHEKDKIDHSFAQKIIHGAVVPHAGYMFSAYQAIHFFEILKNSNANTETFVIINPNHTGYGEKMATESHRFWQTPFGKLEQDLEFRDELNIPVSDIAHKNEHAGEVMLPFLQHFLNHQFKIVMITLSEQNAKNAKLLAKKIDDTAKKLNRKITLIASSDFTHFKNPKKSEVLDNLVLQEIENQNIEYVEKIVREHNISVCGFGPIMCLMEYSSLQGNYKSKILARGHSGQIMPSDEVVNYISIIFYKNNKGSN